MEVDVRVGPAAIVVICNSYATQLVRLTVEFDEIDIDLATSPNLLSVTEISDTTVKGVPDLDL